MKIVCVDVFVEYIHIYTHTPVYVYTIFSTTDYKLHRFKIGCVYVQVTLH